MCKNALVVSRPELIESLHQPVIESVLVDSGIVASSSSDRSSNLSSQQSGLVLQL